MSDEARRFAKKYIATGYDPWEESAKQQATFAEKRRKAFQR